MPDYQCGRCKTIYQDCKDQPTCTVSKQCKDGMFVKLYTPTPVVAQVTVPTTYTKDMYGIVRGNWAGGGHKPQGVVYVHEDGEYAISRDDSSHDGGHACWKGFKLKAQGWCYIGSFGPDLTKVNRGGVSTDDTSELPN